MMRLGCDGPFVLSGDPASSMRCPCGRCVGVNCRNSMEVLLEGGKIWVVPAWWVVGTDRADEGDAMMREADAIMVERFLRPEKRWPLEYGFARWALEAARRGTVRWPCKG